MTYRDLLAFRASFLSTLLRAVAEPMRGRPIKLDRFDPKARLDDKRCRLLLIGALNPPARGT